MVRLGMGAESLQPDGTHSVMDSTVVAPTDQTSLEAAVAPTQCQFPVAMVMFLQYAEESEAPKKASLLYGNASQSVRCERACALALENYTAHSPHDIGLVRKNCVV